MTLVLQVLSFPILMLVMLGCASTSTPESGVRYVSTDNIPALSSLALVGSSELTAVGRLDSQARRAGQGAATGAWAGFAAGGILAAGMCTNPFTVPACVSAFMLGGFYGGAIIGATYGFTGFSYEDQLYVNAVLSDIDEKRDFQAELTTALHNQHVEFWSSVETAAFQALINLETIQLVKKKGVRMNFKASLMLSWVDEDGVPSASRILFATESKTLPIDDWLTNDGYEFGAAIDNAIGELALNMSAYLSELREPSANRAALR